MKGSTQMGLCLGITGFGLCYLYDFNTVLWHKKWLQMFFFIGNLFIIAGSLCILIPAWISMHIHVRFFVSAILSVLFLMLLIYTLFFAIPFDTTYIHENTLRNAYTDGVYALCRHPAVLWFTGLYFSLWLMVLTTEAVITFLIYILMDILYIILQERFIFFKTFKNYSEYQMNTPFLIPTINSIKKCVHTMTKVSS